MLLESFLKEFDLFQLILSTLSSFTTSFPRDYRDLDYLTNISSLFFTLSDFQLLLRFTMGKIHETVSLAASAHASTKLVEAQPDKPTSFILPDLVSHCTFELTYHEKGDEIAKQSVNWLDSNCPDLNAKQRRALRGLQAGELTAFCYNTCSPDRLRVVSDFMNYLFHL